MNDSEAGPSTRATEYFDVFDVFLNHRGPDTKATFVAHLDEALRFEGFQPFLDRQSLKVGNRTDESIYQALDMAKVHVAIVSEGYAESEYCLNELVAIMKSGKPVIPVFYGVEPCDLRWVEKGKFAKAFKKHEKRQTSQEKLQEWRDALRWLADKFGFPFDTSRRDRNEAKLKHNVVNAVKSKFLRGLGSIDENCRVGLEESKKEVVRKLESQGRIGVVGLYGMGGIGKTTLATAVYEYYSQDFQHCSFLRDVRSSDPLTLQKQIIKDLHLGTKVNSCEEYKRQFRKFKDLKVLIVVDDIDEKKQFQDVIPNLDKIGGGSKIIVTSRNQRLLSYVLIPTPQHDMAKAEMSVLHEIELLNRMESQQLFNFHAFPSKLPDNGFEDLAVKVVNACGGHPLALEIASAFLRNKKNLETDRVFWDEMITSKATRDDKLQSILRISYDNGLDNCQKTMFRDISCHLIGKPSAIALEMWASCESCDCGIRPGVHSSLCDLIEKCLVKLDMDGRLRMHDVLRDMGRDIVGELPRSKRTHLWGPEAANVVLEGRKGYKKVRGFSTRRQDTASDTSIPTSILSYDAKAFSEMSELHLLVLDGCLISGDDFSNWSKELRLLQWRFSQLSELPMELNLAKTAVVDLSDSYELQHLWKGNSMDVNDRPKVKRCRKNRKSLRKASRMASMKWRQLILNDCKALTKLPQDIGNRLPMLKVLELGKCSMLESLPDSIGEMKDLERLTLNYCEKLQNIPNTIGRLKKLKHLDLSYCFHLEISPNALENLGTLTALQSLKLNYNFLIKELPESFKDLISLISLKMKRCRNLETVKALPHSLRRLDLGNCRSLEHLPSFEGLTSLTTLTLCNCGELEEIQGLHYLTTLEEVNLTGCWSMQPGTLQLQSNRAMHSCCLSGSNVAVKYDNNWSESEPALQLITYYDNALALGFVDDSLVEVFFSEEDCDKVCLEASVVGKSECMAIVICCVAHDQGWSEAGQNNIGYYKSECCLDAFIVREGREVIRPHELIPLKHADRRDQVYLCTLRRTHPLVRDLKHGDKIQVAARSAPSDSAITVECGAICVVHGDGEDQIISVNSVLLDVQQSRQMSAEFGALVLVDNPECPDVSDDGSGASESEMWAKCARWLRPVTP